MRDQFDIVEVHVLYGFAVILLILFSLFSTGIDFNLYAFFAETVIFLGPVIFMAGYMKIDLVSALSLNKMSGKQWRNSVYFFIFLIPLSLFVNVFSALMTRLLGFNYENALPIPNSTSEIVLQVLIIGLVTAVSEEFFFRGMILNAYTKRTQDPRFTIIGVSFLFALMHFDIQNFLNPFFLGVIFALVNRQTGSIYSSIVGHAIINSFVVLMLSSAVESTEIPGVLTISELVESLLGIGGVAILSTVIALFFFKNLKTPAVTSPLAEPSEGLPISGIDLVKSEKSFMIPAAVVLFYCLMLTLIWRA